MYGINIPTTSELIANNKNNKEIAKTIGADMIIYNELDDVIDCCINTNKSPKEFETSCFNGEYINYK
jgi:amidophosphoribosyltransferase